MPDATNAAVYHDGTEIAGPLTDPGPGPYRVRFRPVASRPHRAVLALLIGANAAAGIALVAWLLLPAHVPGPGVVGIGGRSLLLARLGFLCVLLAEVIRLAQGVPLWVFAAKARDPVPVRPQPGLRVAVLTTIVPAKEPLELVARTLRAMRSLPHDGALDVWILDEGDDPAVRRAAAALGVRHFSRKGRPEYNQPSGAYRARTKAGNHNAWRAEHEHEYDVVAQMDPDHVPLPAFLARTLGFFRDPDVAFVVAPQVYGNLRHNRIAHGAAAQGYVFAGTMQRGANGLDAPLLIGTNHLYRPSAWRQIGGYQDSIIEDQLTGMTLMTTVNPATGNRWKGVYTPDVLAVGEGPTSWTDYFNQQRRWAYGVWEILLRRAPRIVGGLSARQRFCYALIQMYYPSVAAVWVLGNLATGLYLATGIGSVVLDVRWWAGLWGASTATWLVLWLWLRRFNVAPHERREVGLAGFALSLFTAPVYVAAAFAALLRRPLAYAVTAKGSLRSPDRLATFRPHLLWALAAAAALAASVRYGHGYPALRGWAALTLAGSLGPPVLWALRLLRPRRRPAAGTGPVDPWPAQLDGALDVAFDAIPARVPVHPPVGRAVTRTPASRPPTIRSSIGGP